MTKRRLGLPRLLTRAQVREETAQRELADRERARAAQEQAHIVQMEALRVARDKQSIAVDASAFQMQRSQLAAGARAVDEAAEATQAAEHELHVAQIRLFETARERKMLQKLDDRDRAALAVLASRAAQRALDDFGSRKKPQ